MTRGTGALREGHEGPGARGTPELPPLAGARGDPEVRARWAEWVGLALVLAAAAAIRVRVLEVPLERDEGEYAYLGQLILRGVAPFERAWNMKLPGTYAAYALAMGAFGETIAGIRLGLLLANAATTALLFVLARRLLGRGEALGVAATFATLSLSTSVLGLFAHATHFVMLAAVAALHLVDLALRSGRLATFLAAGALFGVATLMKQPGAVFLGVGLFCVYRVRSREPGRALSRAVRESAALVAGAAVPLIVTVVVIAWAGALDRFWLWTVEYAIHYGAGGSLHDAPRAFRDAMVRVAGQAPLVWGVAGLGAILLAWRKPRAPASAIAAVAAVLSLVAVSAGLHFREHYFILALPGVALLVGAALREVRGLSPRAPAAPAALALVLAAGCAHSVYLQRDVLFTMTPAQVSRTLYGLNPFPESIELGRYLKAHTSPEETIAVIGSEPQVFFYADRRSATGYVYTYALMEPQPYARAMQDEMIRQIEDARPPYVVLVQVPTSWLRRPSSEPRIFEWAAEFLPREYEPVARVALAGSGTAEYCWGPDLGRCRASQHGLSVLRRKGRSAPSSR